MDSILDRFYDATQRVWTPFLRTSLALILLWIGAGKFADPTPVVGLLQASLPFLAAPAFVYLLGVLEVAVALLLIANVQVRYAGLLAMALFLGTLTIFVIAPQVTFGDGFPFLTLVGQFLLKDLTLLAATVTLVATDAARARAAAPRMAAPMPARMARAH